MKSLMAAKNVFFIVSLVHILGVVFENEMVMNSTKPLIIPLLILYYVNFSQTKKVLYLIALVCCFLGDVFLISEAELNFMLGLGAFLVAHFLYILIIVVRLEKSSFRMKVVAIIPFVIVFLGLLYFLKDTLGEMMIPVLIYGLVISAFGALAFLNFLIKKTKSSLILLFGALFFILSDGVLAIDKFYDSQKLFSVIIMSTYITAQYFICRFMILNEK